MTNTILCHKIIAKQEKGDRRVLKSVKIRGRVFVSLDFDFAYFGQRFPGNCARHIIPAQLRKEGFKRIDAEHYEKTFSHLMRLIIRIPRGVSTPKRYIWILNEQNFQKMINDLKAIKTHFDNAAQELYDRFVMRKDLLDKSINRAKLAEEGLKQIFGSKAKMKEFIEEELATRDKRNKFMEEVLAARDTARKMKSDFSKKYRSFLNISLKPHSKLPYCTRGYFFFDACRTTKQVRLYFEFIELFLDIFGAVQEAVPDKRRIPPEKIKDSIFGYYVLLFVIKKIRKMYQQGLSVEQLRAKFPWIPEKFMEDITLDAQDKKGWAYRASDAALEYASYGSNTTPDNFKQILKQEREFAFRMKNKIGRMEKPEQFFEDKTGMEIDLNWLLRIEEPAEREKIALIRYGLLHSDYCHRFLNFLCR